MNYYYPPVNFWSVWFSESMLYYGRHFYGNIPPSGSFADIGCGLGNHCFSLLEYSPKETFGFDISKQTIALLNEFGQPVQFCAVDICVDNIESYKSRFDIIYSGDVYEHVNDPNVMLTNIYSMLKPGGYACITFPNEENHGHNQIYDIDLLNKQITDAGFNEYNIEVIVGPSGLYKVFTTIYIILQKLSDKVFRIKRGDDDRRPESDEFHEFYAFKKIQKIKDKKLLVKLINFSYTIMKKIARMTKPYKGHKDYKNIKNKRFILAARKS